MNELVNSVTVLGRPYSITRSRLGAITKVFADIYVCDVRALKELFQGVSEKLVDIQQHESSAYSFLISFSDQTHCDGTIGEMNNLTMLPIGKQTERIVMKWVVKHRIGDQPNELSVTVRISNPINPLVFLQAALSKSPNEIDNAEFEMGSTCVTVDGAGQSYADELFLRVKNWMEARNKPHPYFEIEKWYSKYESILDELNSSLLPLLVVSAISSYASRTLDQREFTTLSPVIFATFFVVRALAYRLNNKMSRWAKRAAATSLFEITNGDSDAVTKLMARAKNGTIKLIASIVFSLILNLVAGWIGSGLFGHS